MKRIFILLILLLVSFGLADYFDSDSFKSYSPKEQAIIKEVVATPELQDLLPKLTNWSIGLELEGYWNVSIFENDEWIGYVSYDESSQEIKSNDLPELLSAEEIAKYEEKINKYLFDDPAIQAIAQNPYSLQKEMEYHKFSNYWSYYLYSGLDTYEVVIYPDDDYFVIDEIRNYTTLEADRQLEADRNKAIELAYSSPDIDQAFDGIDDWYSYAEHFEDKTWIVEFAGQGRTLLSVLVDLDKETVLESKLP